ncbi:DMT family transporter [Streptomyces sp. NEAU-W12]|uniref:DMT family transporter n=1 Tax=Streptomyces sp. NEAU-W12 TaxID=2994668 RepID=UPI00224A6D4B|nr:DMT family transporter [Streptomyces sp. NEAU-W12]MCX2928183.1 DMT family transporter [Streptomyces sp. NEAU-W12]
MRTQSSATTVPPIAVPARRDRAGFGTLQAALGVIAFSLTFPATAWGLEGFGPWSLVAVRCVLAGLIAGGCLLAVGTRAGAPDTEAVGTPAGAPEAEAAGAPARRRKGLTRWRGVPLPARRHWPGLVVVAAGVVLGFPLLTTLALQTSTTAHAAVVVGLLPLTTALFSALRVGSRPSRTFWAAALAGAAAVAVFTVRQSGGALTTADLYLFAALVVCAAGYTEGGRLARVMPGWQVIGWALVLCLPLAVPAAALALAVEPVRLTAHSVAGVLWVAAGSQFLGLVVWYRGMAAIGIPRASQLQLAQPLLTLVWSVFLLGEHLTAAAPLTAAAVLVCIAVTQRARG